MDGLFCPSQIIATIAQENFRRPVKVIESPFFLETKDLDESIYQEKMSDKRYLLYFGTLGTLKGVQDIADILLPLFTNHPDLFFVFVGKDIGFSANCSMRTYILSKSGCFTDHVIFPGKLPHSSLYPLIKHAYAVVLPSHIENFSNACLEAMGLGRIVIGTRRTSFEQLIDDGQNGFLCNANDSIDLLKAIKKVINLSETEKKCLEDNALKRLENLRPEFTVRHLIEYYKEILQTEQIYQL